MSNKTNFFTLLSTFPASISDAAFPELVVPETPTTVEGAIITAAKANIEVVRFLNTFNGMKVRELYGSVGMLSPSAQAIAGGFLQSDGTDVSTAESIAAAIKMIGDETSGGGLTGNLESLKRREDSSGALSLLGSLVSYVPVFDDYAGFLTPIINIAAEIYQKPGRIAEQVGYILLDQVCDLVKQIIVNELYPGEKPEGAPPLDAESLNRIADYLRTMNNAGDEVDVPIGSLLQALQRRMSIADVANILPQGTGATGEFQSIGGKIDTIYNELEAIFFPEDEQENQYNVLVAIRNQLLTEDETGVVCDPPIPIGSLLQAINKRLSILKETEPPGSLVMPLGTIDGVNEEGRTIGDDIAEIAINSNNEGIVEVDGVRLWTHSHVVDD